MGLIMHTSGKQEKRATQHTRLQRSKSKFFLESQNQRTNTLTPAFHLVVLRLCGYMAVPLSLLFCHYYLISNNFSQPVEFRSFFFVARLLYSLAAIHKAKKSRNNNSAPLLSVMLFFLHHFHRKLFMEFLTCCASQSQNVPNDFFPRSLLFSGFSLKSLAPTKIPSRSLCQQRKKNWNHDKIQETKICAHILNAVCLLIICLRWLGKIF